MDLPVQNTVVMPAASLDPAPPTAPANFSAKKPPRWLFIIAGVAIILVVLAVAISFFGKGSVNPLSNSSSDKKNEAAVESNGWVKYTNRSFVYELSLPPSWTEIKHSPLFMSTALFNVENVATLEISAADLTMSLDDFLKSVDDSYQGEIKATKTTQVKVGEYEGYEREESWQGTGLQSIATYIKVQDKTYNFVLSPAGNKNSITSESIIRDYRAALATFKITDTSGLGQDLLSYSSKKVEGLAFSAFSLKYPQTWVAKETVGDNSLEVSVYRNNYEISVSQKAVGGAVCLFSDSPSFEGSSGDLRNKQYSEFNTVSGAVLRRYFNDNAGDKSTMFFCEKQTEGPYFQTPLSIGGLVYNVPAKYDADIIKEMDEIVKTITIISESPAP